MLILSKDDIKKLFTMQEAIQASIEALRMHSTRKTVVPLRINIDIPKQHGQSLFMPAFVDELNVTGIKIVSVYPENVKRGLPAVLAQMILLNGETGEVCAMIDGTYLTQLRTGALQGVATDILARKEAKIAVLFGTGGQARTQLEAMLNVRNLAEVRVCGMHLDRTQQFVTAMQNEFTQFNTRIIAVENGNDVIRDADIITTVTTAKEPVFDGSLVKPGAHINGIGAYTPQMQELPETIIQNADKIFFDTTEGVLSEAGDIIIPIKNGTVNEVDFEGDLGEVILGKVKGRESDQEITLFKSVGMAILDLVTAFRIYNKALHYNVGEIVKI